MIVSRRRNTVHTSPNPIFIGIFKELMILKLADQLSLFKPEGVDYAPHATTKPPRIKKQYTPQPLLKFIYSEKATKFCEIFPLLLTAVHTVKSKGKISQNFAAFSEYMNFNRMDKSNFHPIEWVRVRASHCY